jgi:hypothetical protein
VWSSWIPVPKLLLELLHLLLLLRLIILTLPPLFQNSSIIVCCASVPVYTMLLSLGSWRWCWV